MGSSATKKQLATAEATAEALRTELRSTEDEAAALRKSLQGTEELFANSKAALSTAEEAASALQKQVEEVEEAERALQKEHGLAEERRSQLDDCRQEVKESLDKAAAEADRAAKVESEAIQVKAALAKAVSDLKSESDARERDYAKFSRAEEDYMTRTRSELEADCKSRNQVLEEAAVKRAEKRHIVEEHLEDHLEASLAASVEAIVEDRQRSQALRLVCLENEVKSLRIRCKEQESRLRDYEFVKRVVGTASSSEMDVGNDALEMIGDVGCIKSGVPLQVLEEQLAVADDYATAHSATLASAYIAAGQINSSDSRREALKKVRDRLRLVQDEHTSRKMQSIAVAAAITEAKRADAEFTAVAHELVNATREDLLYKEASERDAEVEIEKIRSAFKSEEALEGEVDASLQQLREEDEQLKRLEEILATSSSEAQVQSDAACFAAHALDEVRLKDSQLRTIADEIVSEVAREKEAKEERIRAVEDELVDALDAEEQCQEAASAVANVASEARGKSNELRSLQVSLEEAELRHEALANTAVSVAEILDSELEEVTHDLMETEAKARTCELAEMKASGAQVKVQDTSKRLWVVRSELESEQMRTKWREAQAALQLLHQRRRRRFPDATLSRLVQPCFEPFDSPGT